MTNQVTVHIARSEDADAAVDVLRRSITELCSADHHGDLAIIGQWLSNKTQQHFLLWLDAADSRLFVAKHMDKILGVASIRTTGEITLNYVSPDARFLGVSKALMNAMEAEARNLGLGKCTLTSTETAHRFYLDRGYEDQKQLISEMTGSPVYQMRKLLK
jgi:GNAT superfamily N-acetyltransferase